MKILENCKIKKYSNMKIGGEVKKFIEIENKDEILNLLEKLDNYFIIGNGTNTLFSDSFLDINFISLKKLNLIVELKENRIYVEAGLDFGKLIKYMKENDYSGLEELSGIPGTVGGLIYMNGGAYRKEIFDFIESVEIIDENKNIKILKRSEIKVGYRNTEIKEKKWIILSAIFKFDKGFKTQIAKKIKERRLSSQPLNLPNLGSIFKNPENNFAAKLIIKAGMQGLKIGGAIISEKHSNFIVNDGTATFEDVMKVIQKVQKKVKENSGIELEKEIIILK